MLKTTINPTKAQEQLREGIRKEYESKRQEVYADLEKHFILTIRENRTVYSFSIVDLFSGVHFDSQKEEMFTTWFIRDLETIGWTCAKNNKYISSSVIIVDLTGSGEGLKC